MTRLTYSLPCVVAMFAMAGCPSDDTSAVDTDEGTSTGADDADDLPDDGNEVPDTGVMTMGEDDTTTGDPTGVDSSSGDPPGPCDDVVCDDGEACVGGICVPVATTGEECKEYGEGTWADCIDGESCDSDDASCIPTGGPGEASCIFQPGDPTVGCTEPCDCPAPPDTGDAPVACAEIVGPGGMDDGISECYLSCEGGETCPDGQTCFANLLCVHTNTVPDEPQGPYEGCNPPAFPCEMGSQCIVDVPAAPTVGTCSQTGCTDATDCPASPPGGTAPVTCDTITMGGMDTCYLDCQGGATCPTDWQCFAGFVCVQPVPEAPADPGDPYGPCPLVCADEDICVEPTVGDPGNVCSQDACTMPSDCPDAPAGGATATVACGDLGGGTDSCYLDCTGGLICPDGMECQADLNACVWPGAQCVNNVEDGGFEAGTPSPAWTEDSTAFGTPLCDAACTGGAGAPTQAGDWWVWFGGVGGDDVEDASVEQDLVLDAGAELSFFLQIPAVTTVNPDQDTMTVTVDGNVVFSVTAEDDATYADYTLVTVPLTPYDDGASHTLRFESHTVGAEVTNFFLDSVFVSCP